MEEEQKVFISTIYGEAALSSPAAWVAIASVILNRVGVREWHNLKTVTRVIANSGFDAFSQCNAPFLRARRCFETGEFKAYPRLIKLMEAVSPLYLDRSRALPDIVLYFSPLAQSLLHEQKPKTYALNPDWDFSEIEEVKVAGAEKDDFRFYKYRTPAVVVGSHVQDDATHEG